ncbi:MAG TPA: GNAT family N-acetyltransferase [Devosiaceae bacterium]
MTDDTFTASIAASTASIPAETWNSLARGTSGSPHNPFLDHAFFLALEESGCATAETGWQAQHILLEQHGHPVGLMPLFLKSHSMGEYVFDHAWADAFQRAGGRYYPKLQAAIPFTPATAPKLLVPSEDSATAIALLDAARLLAERLGASSVHATFIPQAEEELAAGAGWLTRHDNQYHWHNRDFSTFDDFLASLSSRKRKTIRRERRDALADGLRIEWITGSDIQEHHWDAFFAFYMDTGSRKWGRPYLNRAFFSLLSAAMADRIVLMFAYDGDEPIAGTLNLLGTDTLYGRYWGATREVPFLHFELCYYQAIDYAIAHNLRVVEAGAQGEHKLARGYEPVTTRSCHWIAHPGLRQAIEDYLVRERAAVAHDQQVLSRYTPFRRDDHD